MSTPLDVTSEALLTNVRLATMVSAMASVRLFGTSDPEQLVAAETNRTICLAARDLAENALRDRICELCRNDDNPERTPRGDDQGNAR